MKLDVKNLSFSYSKKEVLKDVSFSLQSGQITVLLGKNGAGKSTLIDLLLGFKKPKEGEILIDSTPLKDIKLRERAKEMAFVPQRLEDVGVSVYDFLLLGRLPYFNYIPSLEDKSEITKAIFSFGLEQIAYNSMEEISGGERQLVSIARAMLSNPKFLLLDEPTSSLDIKNQKKVLTSLKDIAKKNDVGIFIVLHDLQEAIQIADHLLLMKDGSIKYDITPDELNEEMIEDVFESKAVIVRGREATYIDFYQEK